MLKIKTRISVVKERIIKWWVRVPFEVHEKALNTIETMNKTIEQLERKNSLLEIKNKLLEDEINSARKKDKIRQEINLEVLPFIDLPSSVKNKVKRLNKKLDKLILE